MFVSNPSALVPEIPTIDSSEARWAVEYLSLMIERLGPDSPVTLVLRKTRRELASLAPGADTMVIGPIRIAA